MNSGSHTRRYDAGIANIKLFSLKKPKSFSILELKSFIKYSIIKSKIVFIALLCLISSSIPILCHAATINYPNDYSSLQAAINAANIGDTILISKGTFSEPNEITLKDGVNIKGIGTVRSDSKIICSIKGASNCTIENLTLEPPDSANYVLTIPPTSRTMKLKACYIYAYRPILIEGSGITLENNIINGDQSRFNQSLPLSLILLRNNPETDIYPNLIKNNTLSIKVENETPLDGYLLSLLNAGNTKITNNILDAVYDSPKGLKILTSGKPLLIEGISTPSIEYNAYVGYIGEALLGKGNITASALSPGSLTNNTTSLPDTSIAKEAGLTKEGQPAIGHTTEIGAFGDAPDYTPPNAPPTFSRFPGKITVYAGQKVKLTFSASDPEGDNFGVAMYTPLSGALLTSSTDPDGSEGVVGRDANGNPLTYPKNGPGPFQFTWIAPAPITRGWSMLMWFWAIDDKLAYNRALTVINIVPDTIFPTITNVTPINGTSTTNRRPSFHAEVSDNIGLKQAYLKLDGTPVQFKVNRVTSKYGRLSGTKAVIDYTPTSDLSYGTHNYTFWVWDKSDNVATFQTSFTVYYSPKIWRPRLP